MNGLFTVLVPIFTGGSWNTLPQQKKGSRKAHRLFGTPKIIIAALAEEAFTSPRWWNAR